MHCTLHYVLQPSGSTELSKGEILRLESLLFDARMRNKPVFIELGCEVNQSTLQHQPALQIMSEDSPLMSLPRHKCCQMRGELGRPLVASGGVDTETRFTLVPETERLL